MFMGEHQQVEPPIAGGMDIFHAGCDSFLLRHPSPAIDQHGKCDIITALEEQQETVAYRTGIVHPETDRIYCTHIRGVLAW
ncbi:hypothetical protein HY58_18600 [Flavihumibacter sp. ZG627]|nr:hypothetical protein HY58_18600 [Flavihumibacter sp. ZG627]